MSMSGNLPSSLSMFASPAGSPTNSPSAVQMNLANLSPSSMPFRRLSISNDPMADASSSVGILPTREYQPVNHLSTLSLPMTPPASASTFSVRILEPETAKVNRLGLGLNRLASTRQLRRSVRTKKANTSLSENDDELAMPQPNDVEEEENSGEEESWLDPLNEAGIATSPSIRALTLSPMARASTYNALHGSKNGVSSQLRKPSLTLGMAPASVMMNAPAPPTPPLKDPLGRMQFHKGEVQLRDQIIGNLQKELSQMSAKLSDTNKNLEEAKKRLAAVKKAVPADKTAAEKKKQPEKKEKAVNVEKEKVVNVEKEKEKEKKPAKKQEKSSDDESVALDVPMKSGSAARRALKSLALTREAPPVKLTAQSRYWRPEEHEKFVKALEVYGPKDVKNIAEFVGTRTPTQVRTHAQKYFLRMEKSSAHEKKKLSSRATSSTKASNAEQSAPDLDETDSDDDDGQQDEDYSESDEKAPKHRQRAKDKRKKRPREDAQKETNEASPARDAVISPDEIETAATLLTTSVRVRQEEKEKELRANSPNVAARVLFPKSPGAGLTGRSASPAVNTTMHAGSSSSASGPASSSVGMTGLTFSGSVGTVGSAGVLISAPLGGVTLPSPRSLLPNATANQAQDERGLKRHKPDESAPSDNLLSASTLSLPAASKPAGPQLYVNVVKQEPLKPASPHSGMRMFDAILPIVHEHSSPQSPVSPIVPITSVSASNTPSFQPSTPVGGSVVDLWSLSHLPHAHSSSADTGMGMAPLPNLGGGSFSMGSTGVRLAPFHSTITPPSSPTTTLQCLGSGSQPSSPSQGPTASRLNKPTGASFSFPASSSSSPHARSSVPPAFPVSGNTKPSSANASVNSSNMASFMQKN